MTRLRYIAYNVALQLLPLISFKHKQLSEYLVKKFQTNHGAPEFPRGLTFASPASERLHGHAFMFHPICYHQHTCIVREIFQNTSKRR